MSAHFNTHVHGHVNLRNGRVLENGLLVPDSQTGLVLLDKDNAVHPQNMATVIARGLSNTDASSVGTHQIYGIALGNGGSSVDSMSQITYLPPNITGASARLYNQTYFEVVDEQQASTPASNSVTYQQSSTGTSSIVIATMTIAAGEPNGQDTTDTPPNANINSQFTFDEMGFFTYGTNGSFDYTSMPSDALLLTHVIFSPVLKTANRELILTYTLTITVS